MNKNLIIKRMRDLNIKWDDISYILDINVSAAKMSLKRANDIDELGEKPVIKKAKFETPVILKLKQLVRETPNMSIRDFPAELTKEFPEKAIPLKSTIHRILNSSGFEILSLKKKTNDIF